MLQSAVVLRGAFIHFSYSTRRVDPDCAPRTRICGVPSKSTGEKKEKFEMGLTRHEVTFSLRVFCFGVSRFRSFCLADVRTYVYIYKCMLKGNKKVPGLKKDAMRYQNMSFTLR